jgi:peptidoglycan/xylan/chitin deacetylase (PgdA/CDA1 family)
MTNPDRFAFQPILQRPRLRLPNGAKLAVWVCPNVEHYEFDPGPVRVRDPWPRTPHPDILGYASKDYGNRAGFWRMAEIMDRYGIRCTLSLNLANFEHYPEIMEACAARDWDVMCHGLYNTSYLWGLPPDEERAVIADCVATTKRLTGKQLAGWFSPAASHTLNTPDLVAEAGIKYYCDFYHDDQPVPVRVKQGRLITLPYQMDLNDSVIYAGGGEGADFLRMAIDMADTLHAEATDQPRILCLAVHPYMIGRPHRAKYLDQALAYIARLDGVWFATGEEIADWYYATAYDAVVGAGAAL